MTVKVVTVELKLPHWLKWSLRIGVPVLLLAGIATLAWAPWTKPHNYASGQPILASEMNENFDTLYTAVNELDERAAVPGTLMWWFCPNTGGCTGADVPTGWTVADGKTVTGQPSSPLNGVMLPDLRNSFVMGVDISDIGTTDSDRSFP